jgi:hypothetical protein
MVYVPKLSKNGSAKQFGKANITLNTAGIKEAEVPSRG